MIMQRLRAIVAVVGLLSPAAGLYGCGGARDFKLIPPPASPTTTHRDVKGKHYRLNRTVYRIELTRIPLSRTRCWLSATGDTHDVVDAPYTDTHTFEWDPSSIAPPVRYASLRGSSETLKCSAEAFQLGKDEDAKNFAYLFTGTRGIDGSVQAIGKLTRIVDGADDANAGKLGDPLKSVAGKPGDSRKAAAGKPGDPLKAVVGKLGDSLKTFVGKPGDSLKAVAGKLGDSLKAVAGKPGDPLEAVVSTPSAFDIVVTVTKVLQGDPDLGGIDATLSRNRSLDPLTPIATELFSVIAEIAVERAKVNATEAVKATLKNSICAIYYAHDDSADVYFPESPEDFQKKKETKIAGDLEQAKTDLEQAEMDFQQAKMALGVTVKGTAAGEASARRATDLEKKIADLKNLVGLKSAQYTIKKLEDLEDGGKVELAQKAIKAAKNDLANVGIKSELSENGSVEDLKVMAPKLDQVVEDLERKVPSDGPNALAPVFSRVCKALDGLRIEEIAASSTVLVRALSGDLTEYAFRYMHAHLGDPDARDFVQALEPVMLGLIEGKTIGTERDFQAMLLRIGAIPIPEVSVPDTWWQCGIGIGFAVVRECLRRDTCSAEQLLSSLDRELKLPDIACAGQGVIIEKEWPELSSILSRSIDVFRPPPGTSANQTAKVATNILLDTLKRSPRIQGSTAVRRDFEAVRSLVNSVFDKDIAAGAVAASSLITSAIDDWYARCRGNGCQSSTTSEQVKKGIALLNAFVSYASTYKDSAREGEDGKTDIEREKVRHDERKKAMENLIEAATNRSNRGGDWVFSTGVGVGLTVGRFPLGGAYSSALPVPSLTLGFALERLPKYYPVGFHVQASVIDLAQYASLDGNGKTAALKAENALFFGLNVGILLGTPKYSVMLAGEFGYSPSLRFEHADRPGVIRAGAIVGTYIPFFDFN